MDWYHSDIWELRREENFPFKLHGVYFCDKSRFPYTGKVGVSNFYEVSIRLQSEARRCDDFINGKPMQIPFPNVVFKTPGMKIALQGELPRDTIAFQYSTQLGGLLQDWKLIPEKSYWPILITEQLKLLIAEFRRLLGCYTLPGMIDRLDWVCFQIMRELVFAHRQPVHPADPVSRIQEAALYFQHHADRKLNCDEVASRFGFSHAAFFREWKRQFDVSPQKYILYFRLKEAARRLVLTDLPIEAVADEVHFSGLTAFHRKFREKYGVSPRTFRKNAEIWQKEFPDLQ